MVRSGNEDGGSRAKLFELLFEAKGSIVPSSHITERLSLTRQAVFKLICALKDEGVPIESIPQKGYKMGGLDGVQAVSPTMLDFFLRDNPVFNKCIYVKEIDSTQKIIKKLAAQDAPEGIVAFSEMQTDGRGRRGRNWKGTPDKNLTFSVLLRPNLMPCEVQLLNLASGLAVKETLIKECGIPAELKWPNDVLCRGKKLCGILSEAAGEADKVYYAVTGIGVNLNMEKDDFPEDIRDIATSVFIESGAKAPRWKVLVRLLDIFASYLKLLEAKNGAESMLKIYRTGCDTIGKHVKVIQDDDTFTGEAVRITQQGALVVLTPSGEMTFAAADVFHLREA